MKAVIPAAGLGTRFLPITKSIPKEMIPIIDRPMIHYIIDEAIQSGIHDIVLITAHGKESIQSYFSRNHELEDRLLKSGKEEWAKDIKRIGESCNIIPVIQEHPAGLGHAVGCAKSVIGNEAFAVLLGDDMIDTTPYANVPACTKQLIDVYRQQKMSVVGVMEVALDDVVKYGIVSGPTISDRTFKVEKIVEKPAVKDAPGKHAIPGRYIVDPIIFKYIAETKPGKNGEIQFTDSLLALAINEGLLAHEFIGDRYDTGDRLGYLDATLTFALRRPELKQALLDLMQKKLKQ
jgi:UTP--glucose-1-phosphate uridylyltransferase